MLACDVNGSGGSSATPSSRTGGRERLSAFGSNHATRAHSDGAASTTPVGMREKDISISLDEDTSVNARLLDSVSATKTTLDAAIAPSIMISSSSVSPPPPSASSVDKQRASIFANHNVRFTMLYNFCDGACFSVWGAQLLPVLLKTISGDTAVGWSAAVCGIAQMVAAVLAGYAGDRSPRQVVIRAGATTGVVAIAFFLAGVYLYSIPVLLCAQGLWGVYVGLVSTSSEALFADCVPCGERGYVYSLKWIVQTLCYVVGYVVALTVLLTFGNEWSVSSVTKGMVLGLALHPFAHAILFTLKDAYALNERNINSSSSSSSNTAAIVSEDTSVVVAVMAETAEKNLDGAEGDGTAASTTATAAAAASPREEQRYEKEWGREMKGEDEDKGQRNCELLSTEQAIKRQLMLESRRAYVEHLEQQQQRRSNRLLRFLGAAYFLLRHRLCSWVYVPYIVCLVDFLMAVGSGVTLQYFPLFFVKECGVTPVGLYMTFIISTCLTAVTSHLVRYVGDHYMGRVPAVMVTRTIGTVFVLLMGTARGNRKGPGYMIPFFIIRNACMNAVMGLTRSVIMDCVAKENRAKWSAFESFSSFTWAGSAMIGGYIVSAHSYQYAFTITALFHFSAIALLLPAAVGAASVERVLRQHREPI